MANYATYDDTDHTDIQYHGQWFLTGSYNATNLNPPQTGTLSSTNDVTAWLTFTFPQPAVGFRYWGMRRSKGAFYQICIDCDPNNRQWVDIPNTVNRTDDGHNPPVILWSSTWPTPGVHVIDITNRPDPLFNGASQLTVDRFDLQIPTTPDSGPAIANQAPPTPSAMAAQASTAPTLSPSSIHSSAPAGKADATVDTSGSGTTTSARLGVTSLSNAGSPSVATVPPSPSGSAFSVGSSTSTSGPSAAIGAAIGGAIAVIVIAAALGVIIFLRRRRNKLRTSRRSRVLFSASDPAPLPAFDVARVGRGRPVSYSSTTTSTSLHHNDPRPTNGKYDGPVTHNRQPSYYDDDIRSVTYPSETGSTVSPRARLRELDREDDAGVQLHLGMVPVHQLNTSRVLPPDYMAATTSQRHYSGFAI